LVINSPIAKNNPTRKKYQKAKFASLLLNSIKKLEIHESLSISEDKEECAKKAYIMLNINTKNPFIVNKFFDSKKDV
jgi:hypothetical protein